MADAAGHPDFPLVPDRVSGFSAGAADTVPGFQYISRFRSGICNSSPDGEGRHHGLAGIRFHPFIRSLDRRVYLSWGYIIEIFECLVPQSFLDIKRTTDGHG